MSQDSAALSLLSLSIAAASAHPIPLANTTAESTGGNAARHQQPPAHHRRLSSTGRRRRLSDARDAATRPSSVGGPTLSMAGLSLSTTSASPPALSAVSMAASAPTKSSTPIPIAPPSAGRGKKRGVDHKCESCSKIYRHPSCLIKHRWEHTPHWRTLSSLPHPTSSSASATGVLSKHAQVQLLEAAAILSHLSPDSETGTSLPEDRGMWPRWVSGGALEGEETYGSVGGASAVSYGVPESYGSSVGGASARSTSANPSAYGLRSASAHASGGPRLHDYEVPRGAEVRAGVVEVPHPANGHAHGHGHHGHMHTRSAASAGSAWSMPRSVSVSASVSSEQSRSRSTPSDDDEESVVDGSVDDGRGRGRGYAYGRGGARVWKHEDEEGEEFGFEFDLGGVREEEGEGEEMEMEKYGHGRDYERLRRGERESLRWGGMEEMDDIDMDMD
ncbi:hypothetical protein B0H16DRAFT_1734114 [Mycena metata]|uniref:C2H2-type domain-containing protein n=1 Tax=Mycena metata TaxID=1033252 RepID=A0AAD7MRS9_9AGAR|nr:hypothetical protein B0H16DRAFT_1734114 [Mycena metata]